MLWHVEAPAKLLFRLSDFICAEILPTEEYIFKGLSYPDVSEM